MNPMIIETVLDFLSFLIDHKLGIIFSVLIATGAVWIIAENL